MRKETPEITICDEMDIRLFSEAEQNAFYIALLSKTTNKRLHELEEQQEALERELLIEKSKTAIKVPESIIREYYEEVLNLEATMIVSLFIKEIVLYNDRIEIYFNSPIKNGSDESQGFSFYKGFISTQCAQTMELEMYVG